jgi:hypothetical protein
VAIVAIALTLAGLLTNAAAAERPGAQEVNSQIQFCVEDGGEADAWVREDGTINFTCEFDDYTVFCQTDGDTGQSGCIILAIEAQRAGISAGDGIDSATGTDAGASGPRVATADGAPVVDERRQ